MTLLLNKSLLTAILFMTSLLANASLIYVDKNASGMNDGTSWANAYTEIQMALDLSVAGDEIWVAQGLYITSSSTGFRFQKNNISFYGGFAGTETLLSQRDHEANPVILSGNMGALNTNIDNAVHVLDINHIVNLLIDGFIVQGGNAQGLADDDSGRGGGAFIAGVVTFQNCWFRNNMADYWGGAIHVMPSYLEVETGDLDLYNCQFTNNSSNWGGGAISYFVTYDDANISNCTFRNNSSLKFGGCIYSSFTPYPGHSLLFDHCEFTDNHSGERGGVIHSSYAFQFDNCLIANNSADSLGAWAHIVYHPENVNDITIFNSTVVNNDITGSGNFLKTGFSNFTSAYSLYAFNNIFWNPALDEEFHLPDAALVSFRKNILSTLVDFTSITGTVIDFVNFVSYPQFTNPLGGDYHINAQSPAVNRGNNSLVYSSTDLDNQQRVRLGAVDLGCYEVQACAEPINDGCEEAIELAGDGSCMFGSTLCAGGQEDVTISCNNGIEGHSVWYKYTSETGGDIDISVDDLEGFDASFDLILSVFQNGCSSSANMLCLDNYDPTQTEPAQIPNPNPGDTYYFRVEGSGQEDGVFNICLSEANGCQGDFNGDMQRDTADLLSILGGFGCSSSCVHDMNGDDITDTSDLLTFLSFYGANC